MTSSRLFLHALTAVLAAGSAWAEGPATPEGLEFFERKIRPVLAEQCAKCHSAESEKIKGGLLLDSRRDILKGGTTGPAATPGDPEKSAMIEAIRYTDEDFQMPPKHRLTPEQVRDFEEWVRMGLPDPREAKAAAPAKPAINIDEARKFWSFQPVRDAAVPAVQNAAWTRGEIDRFLLAKMEERGVAPAGDADRRALLRRATYDLTGMPPTPDEMRAFLADSSAEAFAKVVDRLLASPRYGEQWGRHWLDVVRYADTSGCNSDFPVPSAYRYRNYVITAFNADKPYDEFLREQIAGDLLPSSGDEDHFQKVVATGYLAGARRFGSGNHDFNLTLEDLLDNMGKTVLGLSLGCARCHDHKFDPVPARDYYALYGIFESSRFAFPGTESLKHTQDFTPLIADRTEAARRLAEGRELAGLDARVKKLNEEKKTVERTAKLAVKKRVALPSLLAGENTPDSTQPIVEKPPRTAQDVQRDLDATKTRQEELVKSADAYPKAYAVMDRDTPGNARLHKKGDVRSPGEEVPRGFLTVLGGQTLPPESRGSGRRELADWLTDRANPLTARVMVNRIWQYHFGRGLVKTPNDFGTRGERPTHPELLDWLAQRFVESGWSVKAMHRTMMLSRAYQMASDATPAAAEKDANNDLLSHFNRRRLSAEELRDSILVIAGTLDPSPGGPHPFTRESTWEYTQHKQFFGDFPTNKRSVYLMQQRLRRQAFLATFDGADTNATTAIRPVSNTPLQALWMMNAKFAHEQAAALAERVTRDFPDETERLSRLSELTLGRPAEPDEIKAAQEYLAQAGNALTIPAEQRPQAALASYCRVLLGANEFVFLE
ncbi:MAG: PSD1 and planctomycete cytochrome C domain-containing protein [Chthoniobacter sp.]|nr:PSD1 and planctomycete cytochrome C domain-containing protein [Chthoniobacter sp.]